MIAVNTLLPRVPARIVCAPARHTLTLVPNLLIGNEGEIAKRNSRKLHRSRESVLECGASAPLSQPDGFLDFADGFFGNIERGTPRAKSDSKAARKRTHSKTLARLHRCARKVTRYLGVVCSLALAFALFLTLTLAPPAFAQAGRIYTKTAPEAQGGIMGKSPVELIHAMAVEHDRVRVFLADLSDGAKSFQFAHLPVGKYDLVLVTKTGVVFEGIALGGDPSGLATVPAANLEKRIKVADTFFNRYKVHRLGIAPLDDSGDSLVLAFVERLRPDDVLKQSGERLNQMIRRLEIIELHQAADDWQMVSTRHLFREGEPIPGTPEFLKHTHLPELGSLRVVAETKDLGTLTLPNQ